MSLAPNNIYQGDCIELLAKLAPGSVDLAFADPPFNIGYEYDVYRDDRSAGDYLDWSRKWMAGVARALKSSGTFWLAIGDEYAAGLKLVAQNDLGLSCRSWVIWYYTFGVNCTRAFSRSHTHLLHFVKDPRSFTFNAKNPAIRVPSARQLVYADGRANPRGRLPDNTWILRPQDVPGGFAPHHDTWYFPRVAGTFKEREGFHGCQMPEQLLGRIIRCSSNPLEIVLDPFAGSGTTLTVAKKLGRQWIGIELSKSYADRIKQRLKTAEVGAPLDGAADPLASAPPTHLPNGRHNGKPPKQLRPKRRPPLIVSGDFEKGIVAAFAATHKGLSLDHVLADPAINAAFLESCRQRELPGEPVLWNRALLRVRKAGRLPRLGNRARVLTFEDMDTYSFASEIALARLSVEMDLSLDDILCNPALAAAFDEIAAMFAPGHTPFEYRWAALAIRKRAKQAQKLAQERFGAWLTRKLPPAKPLSSIDGKKLDSPGVYVLSAPGRQPLYVGETLNLGKRIEQVIRGEAWTSLGPASIRFVSQGNPPFALQSVLIARFCPLMNWRALTTKLNNHQPERPLAAR